MNPETLPLWPALLTWSAVGVPLAVALLGAWARTRFLAAAAAPFAALPALALAAVHLAAPGTLLPVDAPALVLGLRLGVDVTGGALLALTAFLWTAAGVYARTHHRDDPRKGTFFTFFAATLTGNLALVLAWDLPSFYLGFALMTFAGWGLVVHHRTEAAIRAGRVYIVLALVGEVSLLAALFALASASGGAIHLGFALTEAWVALGGWAPLVAGLAVAGLGVKAGLVPLHLWLPLAHPVAPTAASALLSGVMIKAGVLGWLRILPVGGELPLPGVGEALVVVGVVGAFYGVVCGLAQDDPKTILAYSSVSQMGYLALGTGLALLLPAEAAPVALAAVLAYALHHGLAKGALFLAVGVAEATPRSGAWPGILRAGIVLPALALAGAPLTAGAVAKGALKDGLSTLGGGWYAVLDPLLLVAAAGTTLLLARFVLVAEGKRSGSDLPPPAGLLLPWAAVVLAGLGVPFLVHGGFLGAGLPLPEGATLPAPTYGALAALLPVLVGVGIAAGVARRPALLGPVRSLRIPPGDLLEPAVALLRRVPRGAGWLSRVAGRVRRALEDAEARGVGRFEAIARRDLVLVRGPVLGAILLLAAVVLAWGGWGR
jgi:formate hydrogenlyase subunit 3/multisubunit Na+/H+ antiporter MnhD subunit